MKANGFTLVELLVALLIFSMLAAAGVALLSVSVRAQESVDARLGALGDLRKASALLAADLAQAAPRIHRDGAGAPRPAFVGGETAVSLVRRGWENVGEERRSSLQKVEYRLEAGRLERIAYPLVDGSAAMEPVALLEDVRQLRLRFRDQRGEWRTRWDPSQATELPVAVEMLVEAEGIAPVRQTFVAGGAG